ncbi:MAG: pseudouridine synthase [Chloroflexota bacterium]
MSMNEDQIRLQKLMAVAGLGSRRDNEKVIEAGRVAVNGRLAKLGDRANPDTDDILVDGEPLTFPHKEFVYVMLNKPRGVISSLEDELDQGRTTVRDLIELPGHLYPVGRLDKPSEGLMLMTNDGQLAHRLTHPRYEHEKQYDVWVEGSLSPWSIDQWRRGVFLENRMTARAPIEVIERTDTHTRLKVILREGRKRQIRRIVAQFGHSVQRLVRLRIGTLRLGGLPSGKWRYLTDSELVRLKSAVAAAQPSGNPVNQKKGFRKKGRNKRKR